MRILMLSGGKDSTYLLKYCIDNSISVDRYVFLDTTLHLPPVYRWIDELEDRFNIEVERKKPEVDFEDKFYQIHKTGNDKGEIWGFPYVTVPCWIRRDIKIPQGNVEGTLLLGYTSDEPDRGLGSKEYIAPLRDAGITEIQVIRRLKRLDLFPPIYSLLERYHVKKPRSGCYFCPKANIGWFRMLYHEYPNYFEKLKEYAHDDPKSFKPNLSIDDIEEIVSEQTTTQNNFEDYIEVEA